MNSDEITSSYTASLKTIFLDDGEEREGDNIAYNIRVIQEYFERQKRGATERQQRTESHSVETKTKQNAATSSREEVLLAPLSPQKVGDSIPESVERDIRKVPPLPPPKSLSLETRGTQKYFRTDTSRHTKVLSPQKPSSSLAPFKSSRSQFSFVSTVRGMYGGERPVTPPYAQDRESAIAGLRRQAAETNATDEVEDEDDNHLNTAPSGLGRILLEQESEGRDEDDICVEDENGMVNKKKGSRTSKCPHCALTREDPPVFQMSAPSAARNSYENKDRPDVPRATPAASARRRYGNLPLGILTPSDTLDTLWELVSILQPPKELQVLGHPPNSRASIPHLAMDEWAILASGHFAKHIGAPPWQEYFVQHRASLEEWVSNMQSDCDKINAQIREAQLQADKLRFRTATLERVAGVSDLADERKRLKAELQTTQHDLVRRRWELEEAERRSMRDRQTILKGKAIVALGQEETRRMLVQIHDMVKLAEAVGLPCAQELGAKAREEVLSIVEELPTTRGASVKRVLSNTHDAHQCPHCLMLMASSPYCPATGAPHGDPLARLFNDVLIADEWGTGTSRQSTRAVEVGAGESESSNSSRTEDAADDAGTENVKLTVAMSTAGVDNVSLSTNSSSVRAPMGENAEQIETSTAIITIIQNPPQNASLRTHSSVVSTSAPQTTNGDKNTNKGRRGTKPVVTMGESLHVRGEIELGDDSQEMSKRKVPSANAHLSSSRRRSSSKRSANNRAKSTAAADAARKREIEALLGSSRSSGSESEGDRDDASDLAYDSTGSGSAFANDEKEGNAHGSGTRKKDINGAILPDKQSQQSASKKDRRNVFARLRALGRARGRLAAGSGSADISAAASVRDDELGVGLALEVMANHLHSYLTAAADKDFPSMRAATQQLVKSSAYRALFTDSTLRSLTDVEEQFYAWYSVVGQLLPASADASTTQALIRRAKATNVKSVEQRCLALRKELRNLEYAFQKRPKGRSGALLDDSSFAALALKIADFERKNASLRIKLRQINEQRRALARSLPRGDNSAM